MNMISTGAFLPETDASTKQNELVKKLTSAWEKKNSKTARAGGASLMALSLAACGGEDNTPFSAADVSAAEAAATTAALTGADGTVYASVDAAVTSNDTAIADAARAEGVASVDITSDNTDVMMSQADYDAAIAAADDAVQASLDALQVSYDALLVDYNAITTPNTSALTDDDATGVGPDTPAMTVGNDVLNATSSTYDAADVIADSSTTDSDVLNVAATGDVTAAATIINVETIAYELNAASAAGGDGAQFFDVDLTNISGANTVTFDVTREGSAVTSLSVDAIKSGMTITASSDFTTVNATSVDNADYTLNVGATTATGVVSVVEDGATANDISVVSTSALTMTSTTLDGDLTLNAAGDIIVTESDESATLTATSSAGSVTVTTADTATSLTLTAADEVVVTGADAATTVTVAAQGTGATGSGTTASSVTATAATTLNASGNGGALVLDASGSTALTAINVSGDQSVSVEVAGSSLTAANSVAFTDTSTAGESKLEINATGAGITMDLVDVAADVISVDVAVHANDVLSVASGATVRVDADLTNGLEVDGVYASRATNSVTIEFGDDATATDSNDITGTLEGDNLATVNLVLNDTSETGGGIDIPTLDFATAAVTISGASDVDINAATAASIDGSSATGAIDILLTGGGTVKTVTTGSAGDTVTSNTTALTSGAYTISTGAGADTIVMDDANGFTVDGGAGVDTLQLTAALGDYTGVTISTSNIEVLDVIGAAGTTGAANTTQIDSSMLTGQSFVVKDTTVGAASVIDVTVDGATVDLSGLATASSVTTYDVNGETFGDVVAITFTGSSVIDNVDTGNEADSITTGAGNDIVTSDAGNDYIDGGAGDDNLNGEAGNDTIIGGAGGDTLTGEAGADTITAGEGADTVTGGAGNDTIDVSESTAAVDNIVFTSGASSTNGVDVISGFAAGSGVDTLTMTGAETTVVTGAAAGALGAVNEALATSGAAYGVATDVNTAAVDVVEITTTLDDDVELSATSSGADLMQALSSDATEAGTITVDNASDAFYLAVYQNGNAYLWLADDSDGGGAIESDELDLIAVLEGVTAGGIAAGDILVDA